MMTRSERIEAAADKVLETSESPNHTNVQDEDAVLVSFSKIEALRAALALPQETCLDRTRIARVLMDCRPDRLTIALSEELADAILALIEKGGAPPECTCGHDNPEQGGVGHGVFCPAHPNKILEPASDRLVKAVRDVAESLERCKEAIGSDGDWQGRCGDMDKRLRAALALPQETAPQSLDVEQVRLCMRETWRDHIPDDHTAWGAIETLIQALVARFGGAPPVGTCVCREKGEGREMSDEPKLVLTRLTAETARADAAEKRVKELEADNNRLLDGLPLMSTVTLFASLVHKYANDDAVLYPHEIIDGFLLFRDDDGGRMSIRFRVVDDPSKKEPTDATQA